MNDLDFSDIGDYYDSDVYFDYKKNNTLPVDLILKSKLDGNGKTISNLSIHKTNSDEITLFKKIDNGAIIQDLKIDNFDMSGNSSIALLTIDNFGLIQNVEVTGTISSEKIMAGIAVNNYYIIQDSTANITITGDDSNDVARSYIGGIAGRNRGVIERVTTNGTISGLNSIGGIVGKNYDILRNAVSNVNVTSSDEDGDHTGGIVGINEGGRIENVIAYGEVIGHSYTGGLVGSNIDGSVMNSVAGNKSISGAHYVGSIIGINKYTDANSADYGTYNNYYFSNIPLSAVKLNTDTDTMGGPINSYDFVNVSQTMAFWNIYKGNHWDFQNVWEVIQVQLQD